MTQETAGWIRLSINSILSGIIASGGALLTASGKDGNITKNSVIFAIITGAVIAANDIKSRLTQPPPVAIESTPQKKIIMGE